MKLMFIILAVISVHHACCMDYKKALLSTTDEIIINELRLTQSRPRLVSPRVDTTEVNQKINETFEKNNRYRTKTEIAVSVGTPEARQWLLDQMEKPEMFQEALQTLHEYIAQEDVDNIKRLLQWTALDANGNSFLIRYRDRHNTSFVHRTLNNPAMLALVLDAGANPDARDHDYLTPLHKAARHGHLESVKYLLRAGANPNIRVTDPKNPWIETPLFSAIHEFRATRNPDRQYKFFKIAAYLVINKEGTGGNANYDTPNSSGLSAKAFVNQIKSTSIETQKLKKLMLYRKPGSSRQASSSGRRANIN